MRVKEPARRELTQHKSRWSIHGALVSRRKISLPNRSPVAQVTAGGCEQNGERWLLVHTQRDRGVSSPLLEVVCMWHTEGRSTLPPLYYRPLYNSDTLGPGALAVVLMMLAATDAEVAGTRYSSASKQCLLPINAAGSRAPLCPQWCLTASDAQWVCESVIQRWGINKTG